MRGVLYSPGYGAGWVTWHGGTREQKKFMLEYQPLVDYLLLLRQGDEEKDTKKMNALLKQFSSDWKERFPGEDEPYYGGWKNLEVKLVGDGKLVRIEEYDGSEGVQTVDEMEWL